MARTTKEKPKKTYPSYPLAAHPNGQWCKKVKRKLYFFGVWADPDGALQRHHAQAADLHAGRRPRALTVSGGGLAIKDVCKEFLNWQRAKADAGDIGYLWFEQCRKMVATFAEAVGKGRLVSDLRPEDFQQHRTRLATRLGVHALARQVTAIRRVFKHAHDVDLIDRPVKFGTAFSGPGAARKRKSKSRRERENDKRLLI